MIALVVVLLANTLIVALANPKLALGVLIVEAIASIVLLFLGFINLKFR